MLWFSFSQNSNFSSPDFLPSFFCVQQPKLLKYLICTHTFIFHFYLCGKSSVLRADARRCYIVCSLKIGNWFLFQRIFLKHMQTPLSLCFFFASANEWTLVAPQANWLDPVGLCGAWLYTIYMSCAGGFIFYLEVWSHHRFVNPIQALKFSKDTFPSTDTPPPPPPWGPMFHILAIYFSNTEDGPNFKTSSYKLFLAPHLRILVAASSCGHFSFAKDFLTQPILIMHPI